MAAAGQLTHRPLGCEKVPLGRPSILLEDYLSQELLTLTVAVPMGKFMLKVDTPKK